MDRYFYSVLMCILLKNCVMMSCAYTSYPTEHSVTLNDYDNAGYIKDPKKHQRPHLSDGLQSTQYPNFKYRKSDEQYQPIVSHISVQTQMQSQQTGSPFYMRQQQFQAQYDSVHQMNTNSKQTQFILQLEMTHNPLREPANSYTDESNTVQVIGEMAQSQEQKWTQQTVRNPQVDTSKYPNGSQESNIYNDETHSQKSNVQVSEEMTQRQDQWLTRPTFEAYTQKPIGHEIGGAPIYSNRVRAQQTSINHQMVTTTEPITEQRNSYTNESFRQISNEQEVTESLNNYNTTGTKRPAEAPIHSSISNQHQYQDEQLQEQDQLQKSKNYNSVHIHDSEAYEPNHIVNRPGSYEENSVEKSQSYTQVYEKDCVFNLDSPVLKGIFCPIGVFGSFPYPFGNYQFINCTNYGTYVEDCPRATSFNIAKSYCEVLDINGQKPTSKIHRVLTCPKEFNGSFLYPFDPTKYIVCQDGNMLKESCANDQFYSMSMGKCVSKQDVGHSDRVRSLQDMRPIDSQSFMFLKEQLNRIECPLDVLGVFPYPFANTHYIKCINGELMIRQCAPGYFFSLSRKLCDISHTTLSFDTAVPITGPGSQGNAVAIEVKDTNFLECPSDTNDTFIYPFLPTRYIKCSNGNTVIENCSDEEVYGINEKRCLHRMQVNDNDIVRGIETSLKWTTNDYTLGVTCNTDSSGDYAHPEDWTKFVSCQDGVIRMKSCSENKTFDLEHNKCIQ